MSNRTNKPERPAEAARLLAALQDAYSAGRDGLLTEGERDLLTAVDMLFRHRLGEPGPDGAAGIDLGTLAAFVLERGTEKIAAEREQRS